MKTTTPKPFNYKTGLLIVVGASAGGLSALIALFQLLPENFTAAKTALSNPRWKRLAQGFIM